MNHFFTEYQPYFFTVIGLVLLLASVFLKSKKNGLKETGIAAEGIIYEQESYISFSLSSDNFSSSAKEITVRFVTQREEWITGIIDQNFQTSYTGQYTNGDPVTVYYKEDNPSEFYIDTGQSETTGRIIIGLAGFICTATGLCKLFF